MPAKLHWVLADVTDAAGAVHEKVSIVVQPATGVLTVKRRSEVVMSRRDVTAVVDTGVNMRRVDFADGSSLNARRLSNPGGCAACRGGR